MPLNASNWAELITPATSEAFYMAATRHQSYIPTLFDMRSSSRADEQHLGVGQFSTKGWNEFQATGRVSYVDEDKGWKTTFTHKEFAQGFVVQRRLIDDNLTQIVFDQASELGDSAFRFREKSAAKIFANAFSTGTDEEGFTKTLADAVALCSASHPLNALDSTTQSNTGTSALTKASVASTRIAMLKFTDDVGDPISTNPDLLLVPPELEDTALEIVRSQLDPTSANNTINAQNGRFQVLVWNYLSDTNNWFMIDRVEMKRSLIWYDRIPLEFGRMEDFDTFEAKFRAYNRFSRGARDWKFVYGQSVT